MSREMNQKIGLKTHPLLDARMRSLEVQKAFSLEQVSIISGVVIINDSAATTGVQSIESLLQLGKKVCWVLDAKLVLDEHPDLAVAMKEYAHTVIAVGPNTDSFFERFNCSFRLFASAASWDEALENAIAACKANDTVLISPGTRAIDPFQDYKERGAYLNRLVYHKSKEYSAQ